MSDLEIKSGKWVKFDDYEHPNPGKNSCISSCETAREILGKDWRRVAEVFPNGGGKAPALESEETIPFVKIAHGNYLRAHIPLSAISYSMTLISKDEELLVRADALATDAHLGKWRKFQPENKPMWAKAHADRTEQRLVDAGLTSTIVRAAAKCHDIIEDCDPDYTVLLASTLGPEVFSLVYQVSNPSKNLQALNRAQRKAIDHEFLRHVSPSAIAIKLADRADNLRDMPAASKDFRQLYLQESLSLFSSLLARLDGCPGGKYGYPPHRKLIIEYEQALSFLENTLK